MSKLVNENGIIVVEFHYSKIIMDELHYDSICHEHLFYFSIKTISTLFKKYDLVPFVFFLVQLAVVRLLCFLVKTNYTNLII